MSSVRCGPTSAMRLSKIASGNASFGPLKVFKNGQQPQYAITGRSSLGKTRLIVSFSSGKCTIYSSSNFANRSIFRHGKIHHDFRQASLYSQENFRRMRLASSFSLGKIHHDLPVSALYNRIKRIKLKKSAAQFLRQVRGSKCTAAVMS